MNGYGFWISLLIVMPMGELMMPQIWTRIYAIKEKKTFYIMPILLCISTIAYAGPMLAGNAALVLEPDYNGSVDYILPTMLINYLPPVLMSIIICCAVSACLSTANSQLHSLSQIIILDVYKNCFNTKATEKHLVFMAKLVILLIAVFTYMLLLSGSLTTIFDTTLMSFCVPCRSSPQQWEPYGGTKQMQIQLSPDFFSVLASLSCFHFGIHSPCLEPRGP